MAEAWRIIDWDEMFEVNDKGGPWSEGQAYRVSAIPYVRLGNTPDKPTRGRMVSGDVQLARRQDLQRAAGPDGFASARGLYDEMCLWSRNGIGGQRGWLLDRKKRGASNKPVVMVPEVMALRFGMSAVSVLAGLMALEEAEWIEVGDCPFAVEAVKPVRCEADCGGSARYEGADQDSGSFQESLEKRSAFRTKAKSEGKVSASERRRNEEQAGPLRDGQVGGGVGEDTEFVGSPGVPAGSCIEDSSFVDSLDEEGAEQGASTGTCAAVNVEVRLDSSFGSRDSCFDAGDARRGATGPISPGNAKPGVVGKQQDEGERQMGRGRTQAVMRTVEVIEEVFGLNDADVQGRADMTSVYRYAALGWELGSQNMLTWMENKAREVRKSRRARNKMAVFMGECNKRLGQPPATVKGRPVYREPVRGP